MTFERKDLGATGEDLATQFLIDKNYKILARNLKLRYGEIDILAADGTCTVIVEVKTKTNLDYGQPYEMVHAAKQQKLRRLAEGLAMLHKIENYRIDVVSVDLSDIERPKIEHLLAAC